MRKTIIISALGICAAALMSLCVVQHLHIQRLSAELASLKPPVATPTSAAVGGAGIVPREMPVKQQQPVATAQTSNAEAVFPIKPPLVGTEAAPTVAPTASAPTNQSPMAGIAEMMKSPGMKDMIRAQQKGQMDLTYGSLFKYLQLSDEELENFQSLLLDKQMALVDLSLSMMNNAATPEERNAAGSQITKMTADYNAQIKDFLGDDNYAVYQSFEATQPERMQVTLFKGSLSSDDAMTEEQEDTLIRAMHDERTNFHYSATGFGDQEVEDPSQFTPDRIAKLLEDTAKLQEQYVSHAAEILTPSQLEQFKASQKQQQAMQEMAMKMASKMFGQPAQGVSTNSP